MLYDEKAAEEAIKALPSPVKMHLSHVVRNGMACVLSAARLGGDVEKVVMEMEARWEALGL